jgi:DnaK suppressor protein
MPTPVPVEASPKPASKPAKVLLRKKDLDQLRQALEEERQRLIAQMAALDETASLTGPSEVNENVPGYSIHLAEYASENQVVETTLAQRALQAERLAEIEEALLRINNPGYGICQNCGKEIGLERLKVKPSAQFCVPCRQLKEQGRI